MRKSITDEMDVVREDECDAAAELPYQERKQQDVPRGFAAMSPEWRRRIASLGGRAAHARGTAHRFSSIQGRKAGHKGGLAVSADREHMARIGQIGGKRRWQRER